MTPSSPLLSRSQTPPAHLDRQTLSEAGIRCHPLAPRASRAASVSGASLLGPQNSRSRRNLSGKFGPLADPPASFSVEQKTSLVPWPIRRIFRAVWWLLCILTLLALPLVYWEFRKREFDIRYQAWFIGGVFVILSFPISLYEVAMHTEYYTQPRLQRHVIRILWMVPIYAVDAWFALRFQDAREYLDPIREIYEAYVIYNFLAYLLAFLEGTVGNLDTYRADQPPVEHRWGFQFITSPWPQGQHFLWECKKGVLNYVILRPVCTVVALITDQFGVYGQGEFSFRGAYIYITAINNFSQGVLLNVLVSTGVIKHGSWSTYDELDVASGIQDFLICIEMFLAALAHTYAFPPRDYMDPNIPTKGFFANVRYMFDLRDVVDEVQEVLEDHYDNATDGLHQVVRIPQHAMKTAAGLVSGPQEKLFGLFQSRELSDEASQRRGSGSELLLSIDEHDGASSANGSGSNGAGSHGSPSRGASSAYSLPRPPAAGGPPSFLSGAMSLPATDASFVTATGGSSMSLLEATAGGSSTTLGIRGTSQTAGGNGAPNSPGHKQLPMAGRPGGGGMGGMHNDGLASLLDSAMTKDE